MEYWEFLLQKEGDQAWLPLEASEVEILEGRYRLMVHTSQLGVPVNIRISQKLTTATGRRVLKRRGTTNQNGLMVIMPFTWLREGIWEIHCAVATEAESCQSPEPCDSDAGDLTQQYAVQLHILSQESTPEDDWITDPWTNESLPADTSWEGLSEASLAIAFESIDQALAETVGDQDAQAARGLVLSSQYCVELAQSALMARQGALTVVGQVMAAPEMTFPNPAIVALRLIDPQTGQTLTIRQQSVERPCSFAIPISLPTGLTTRLLLGEVALVTPQTQVLAVQRFTVTVDLSSLIDAIANQAEDFDDFDIVFPDAEPGEPEDETSLVFNPVPPPRAVPILLPREGETLPPKIYYPSPHEITAHEPALPPLRRSARIQPIQPGPASESEADAATDDPATKDPSTPNTPQLPAFALKPPRAKAPPRQARPETVEVPPIQDSPAPEPDAFQNLNLQERFWLRLNALAVENHQAALERQVALQSEMNVAAAASPDIEPTAPAEPFASEVVVYEEDEDALEAASTPSEPEGNAQADPVSPPTPIIDLSAGELVAGSPLPLTLRVPIHFNRIYLKLWITDPQTRTLADPPRQLMHLSPDGYGNLSTAVQLTVPEGCLEAQIEAISVDMVTHQESYKASIRRPVVPADVK